jgi:hypothetical protein
MHSSNALPVLPLDSFGGEDLPNLDADLARFVKCLVSIAASEVRKEQAFHDYRLSFAHRSRWARRGLLGTGEISRYEANLSGDWLISAERMLRTLPGLDDENQKAATGHDLWDELEQAALPPIRRDTTDSFIQRGSFHQLAEDGRVAWHPDEVQAIHDEIEKQ